MRGQLLGKTRFALMLFMFVTAQTHSAALAQSRGGAQHPTLLAGYAKRPPWNVAGVDYAVGVPSTTRLIDWQLLNAPGITVNATATPPNVSVYNTSNVVIFGVDFSLHGGASLRFVNSPNPKVVSSKFGGTNLKNTLNAVIYCDPATPGLTVLLSTIDGAGSGLLSTLISTRGAGTTTLEYNWFKNFSQHVLENVQPPGLTIAVIYKNNLIEQGGMTPGAHLNFLQFDGLATVTSTDVEYNTTYQTPQIGKGEGFQFVVSNITFAYNTMIATGGGPGSAMSYMVHATPQNPGNGHDNYFDVQAAYGVLYPGSVDGWTLSNNYLMTTGAKLSPR